MIWPTATQFKEFHRENKIIPVWTKISMGDNTPINLYERLGGPQKHSFILESGKGAEKIARFSFVGNNPFLIFHSYNDKITVTSGTSREEYVGNPIDILQDIMGKYPSIVCEELPKFPGGAIGYFSYDLVRFIEKMPQTAVDELLIPEMYLMFVDWVYIFDHLEQQLYLVVNSMPGYDVEESYQRVCKKLEEMKQLINKSWKPYETELKTKKIKKRLFKANFIEEEFAHVVSNAKEYIAAGDIFQVNLSVRLYRELHVSPYLVYKFLREINPSPYGCYLNLDQLELISCSPELLVKKTGDLVETRPIAGTRKRGKDKEEDMALTKELLSCAKENAEHIMLVDLERNDLGRVCVYGSVQVDELMVTEEYSHVIHIVSNVKGQLRPDKDCFDLIRATFPGGTITGAPKVRCMEIIEELEGVRRGVYTGSIGWLSFTGDMELNIAIRTILVKDKVAYVQAGAGIVADSNPYKEYQESLKKAEAMIKAIEKTEEAYNNDFNDR